MSFLFYVVLTFGMTLASLLLFSLLDMAQRSEESLDRLELERLWIKETASPSRKGRTPMMNANDLSAPRAVGLYHGDAPPTRLCNRR